jgi:hypothetical protein
MISLLAVPLVVLFDGMYDRQSIYTFCNTLKDAQPRFSSGNVKTLELLHSLLS